MRDRGTGTSVAMRGTANPFLRTLNRAAVFPSKLDPSAAQHLERWQPADEDEDVVIGNGNFSIPGADFDVGGADAPDF